MYILEKFVHFGEILFSFSEKKCTLYCSLLAFLCQQIYPKNQSGWEKFKVWGMLLIISLNKDPLRLAFSKEKLLYYPNLILQSGLFFIHCHCFFFHFLLFGKTKLWKILRATMTLCSISDLLWTAFLYPNF